MHVRAMDKYNLGPFHILCSYRKCQSSSISLINPSTSESEKDFYTFFSMFLTLTLKIQIPPGRSFPTSELTTKKLNEIYNV